VSLTPAVCRVEGPIDRDLRAGKHTLVDNSVATAFHARASLRAEETRQLSIHFVDSRLFKRGRK
jgi:hypothetical protein